MTEKKYIVALDQGTTSSRAVVMDHDANIISVSQRELMKCSVANSWGFLCSTSTLAAI